MSKNEARRQKQLAKKKAKRDAKRVQVARQHSDNPLIRLADAPTWPILAAWAPEDLSDGMGLAIIARRTPDGKVAMATLLIDSYCLGVKDGYWKILSEWEYDRTLRKHNSTSPMRSVTPEYVAKLVYGAVDYAGRIGIAPHPDYRYAKMLLAGIDPSSCPETFIFGKDGKPLYINGPHDSPERMKVIMHKVQLAGGDFVMMLDEGGDFGPDADEWEDSEELEEVEPESEVAN